MPLIGAGLGGGSWKVINAIIEEECKDIIPNVYYFPEMKLVVQPYLT